MFLEVILKDKHLSAFFPPSCPANSLTSLSINLHQKDIFLIRPYKSVFGHDDVTSTNLKQGQITEMQRDADHRNAENTK